MAERPAPDDLARIRRGWHADPARSFSLSAEAYTDPRWFAHEREAIFARSWQWVCHAEKLRAPGAYVTAEVAGRPVCVVRDREGVLRAFYNVCKHRAHELLSGEGIHLVTSGVASVEDVDKAVWAGPGLRWAAMGPTMLFNLGAGQGGVREFCARFADSFHRWWDDLGEVELDYATALVLTEGAASSMAGRSLAELSAERDRLLLAILAASRTVRAARTDQEGSQARL